MVFKKSILSLLLLLSPATTLPYLSSYISAYANMGAKQIVSSRWSPVLVELNADGCRWEANDDCQFTCKKSGVYFILVSAMYNVDGADAADEVRLRGLVNNRWTWGSSAVDKVGCNSQLFLQFHDIKTLKKGDVVHFEHMRTGENGLITSTVDMLAPSVVITIMRVD